MSRLVIFGGTGGLGRLVTPLLATDFTVMALGSADVDVVSEAAVWRFFEREEYIPYVVYMAVQNRDSMVHKLDTEDVTTQIDVNIKGFLHVLRYSLPAMRTRRFGRILYMSSILSTRSIPGTGIYAATKAFNDNLIKTCALENARHNITCNSIQMGYCNAGLTDRVPTWVMDKVLEKIPVGRLGNAVDLYQAITFVLNSPYLTGATIGLNGGLDLA